MILSFTINFLFEINKKYFRKIYYIKQNIKIGDNHMAKITFDIKENFGELSKAANGWTKELNLVSWNNREAKYDIRTWDEEHESMGKGITLDKEELIILKGILNNMEL